MESSSFGEILRGMSPEDLEAFKRGAEAFNRRDVEGVLEVLDPDVEWHDVFTVMLGGEATIVRGHEGVRELIRDQDEVFAEFDAEYSEIRDLGQRLVAIGVIRTCGRGSGAETRSPLGTVVDFKNGKVILLRTFLDTRKALEAAGLSE
jgi:ketosteroid isomerase-like protein